MKVLKLLGVLAVLATPIAATAQSNLFAPAVRVNDRVITNFELDQRVQLYSVLSGQQAQEDFAIDRLVEERLQLEEARRLGVSIGPDEVNAGMEEFASRVNMTTEQFLAAIGQSGVAPETFQDFVRAGMAWRQVVQGRFGPRVNVTEEEIDRALALDSEVGGVRVLLSEIFLPADTPERLAAARSRATEIQRITSISAFAAAARQYSAAPSRNQGGRQDWIDIGNLPPALRAQILTLAPGQVTEPIDVPNAVALFQLRELQETGGPNEQTLSVEFARYFIPGGRSAEALAAAARIQARVDTCDDLYGVAEGQPEDRLLRDVLPVAEVQGDIAVELAKLDANEVSTALTTGDGGALVFLMLCGRTVGSNEEADREALRGRLTNQRLNAYATGLLSELRAEALVQRLK